MDKHFDLTTFGELLIDFTNQGYNEYGTKLFAQNAGGAPANVAVAVARLGLNTAFIGKIGTDIHGEYLRKTLQDEKINTDGLISDDEYFTTLAFVDIDECGERSFSFARKHGADVMINCDEIDIDIIKASRIFHIGSLLLTADPAKEATYYALEIAKQNGVIISYDPNYRASLWDSVYEAKVAMQSVIPYADVMKISDEEIELITGTNDVISAGKALIAQGVKVVVVTLGSKGAMLFCGDNMQLVKGYTTNVVDTTGAGDAFWGGFLYSLLKNEKPLLDISFDEMVTATNFANTVAAVCITKQGAIPSMPTAFEVDRFFLK